MGEGAATFANHRGVAPLLWAFSSIAFFELFAAHLFVSLKWPTVAWGLTAISALSIVWLIGWIRSWKRLPHRLVGGVLTLHMGSLRRFDVSLNQIARIATTVTQERVKAKGTRNLVPVALPNRIVELNAPLAGRRRVDAIAVRLDDPAAFDAAMLSAGVPVGP